MILSSFDMCISLKKMSSNWGYTLTGELPGKNAFLQNGNN
jgi:hypothetical protein